MWRVYEMEYEEIEKLSLEESKKQTKERREEGLNMIRPFTFDEKKILWDGLYNDGYYKGNKFQEEINASTNN
jgi:hypothetical protein